METFGRWIVLSTSTSRKKHWLCRCQCGTVKEVNQYSLKAKTGASKSCGCLRREVSKEKARKHGMSKTSYYNVWANMWQRCTDPNAVGFDRYGGRGITICARWESFGFFQDDMGPRPTDKHQIDRIDNDGNYEPSNCRWATPKENGRNTSHNRLVEICGQIKCVSEWCEHFGGVVNLGAAIWRLKNGWPPESCFIENPNPRYRSDYCAKHPKYGRRARSKRRRYSIEQ